MAPRARVILAKIRHIAVQVLGFVLLAVVKAACGAETPQSTSVLTSAPTPDVEATVQARLKEKRAIEATAEAKAWSRNGRRMVRTVRDWTVRLVTVSPHQPVCHGTEGYPLIQADPDQNRHCTIREPQIVSSNPSVGSTIEFAASAASLDTHVIRVKTASEIDTALAEARREDGLPSSSWI